MFKYNGRITYMEMYTIVHNYINTLCTVHVGANINFTFCSQCIITGNR